MDLLTNNEVFQAIINVAVAIYGAFKVFKPIFLKFKK